MTTPLPSSLELTQSPELAILHAFHAALKATEVALLAAHPELEERDLSANLLPVTPMACAADLLLIHLHGIDSALHRYTAQLHRNARPGTSRDDF